MSVVWSHLNYLYITERGMVCTFYKKYLLNGGIKRFSIYYRYYSLQYEGRSGLIQGVKKKIVGKTKNERQC